MKPNKISHWLECQGQRYWIEIDDDRTLLSAQIKIEAHDKRPTLRKVVNKVTMQRLQAVLRPEVCGECGR